MIPEIRRGDKIQCLFCKKPFVVEHIELRPECEVLTCPICGACADIQQYHIHGVLLAVKEATENEEATPIPAIPPESANFYAYLKQKLKGKDHQAEWIADYSSSKSALNAISVYVEMLAEAFIRDIENGEPLTQKDWAKAYDEMADTLFSFFYGS